MSDTIFVASVAGQPNRTLSTLNLNMTMNKLRFIRREDRVEIRAKLKATGQYATLGFVHPATVALILKDGIRAHSHLIKLK